MIRLQAASLKTPITLISHTEDLKALISILPRVEEHSHKATQQFTSSVQHEMTLPMRYEEERRLAAHNCHNRATWRQLRRYTSANIASSALTNAGQGVVAEYGNLARNVYALWGGVQFGVGWRVAASPISLVDSGI